LRTIAPGTGTTKARSTGAPRSHEAPRRSVVFRKFFVFSRLAREPRRLEGREHHEATKHHEGCRSGKLRVFGPGTGTTKTRSAGAPRSHEAPRRPSFRKTSCFRAWHGKHEDSKCGSTTKPRSTTKAVVPESFVFSRLTREPRRLEAPGNHEATKHHGGRVVFRKTVVLSRLAREPRRLQARSTAKPRSTTKVV